MSMHPSHGRAAPRNPATVGARVPRVAIVDDETVVTELVADRLREQLGVDVSTYSSVGDFQLALGAERTGFDIVVADLSFPREPRSGLDAVLAAYLADHGTAVVLYSDSDGSAASQLRDVWEAVPLAGVVSKGSPVAALLETVRRVLAGESAIVDPLVAALLPSQRSPFRTFEAYAGLVPHAGHAKLWRALVDGPDDPSYKQLQHATGLRINTLRNYRNDLLPSLRLHGLDNPTIKDMQHFARRVRALLIPHVRAKLPGN
ncbi:MAG: response regulator transcription factor [Acidimicrobiales bacterium]|nr:response regulator transcription factor [Acidimicrobiales bacterium]